MGRGALGHSRVHVRVGVVNAVTVDEASRQALASEAETKPPLCTSQQITTLHVIPRALTPHYDGWMQD